MPQVSIIGAGIAGLAAAFRLLQRGFDVTLLEQNSFLGGKLGAHRQADAGDYHEHSYHMYLNWYHNFWSIVDDVGIRGSFFAQPMTAYLSAMKNGRQSKLIKTIDVGSVGTTLQNLFSGLRCPPDMYIYSYSLLDLVSTPAWRHEHLGATSVMAFMNSRGYMTDQAMSVQQDMLAKAFASPSFLTASNSFRRFLSFGFQCPVPMMWLLQGNTQEALMGPLEAHMVRMAADSGRKFEVLRRHEVTELVVDDSGGIVGLKGHELADRPYVGATEAPDRERRFERTVPGDVILAAPPQAVARLVNQHVFRHAPELANVRKLRSEPMISMDLYFRTKLPDLPNAIVNLQGSEFDLSFLDTSQAWGTGGNTVLNVVASDVQAIVHYDQDMLKRTLIEGVGRYIPFHHDDIDHRRTYLQTNLREALFTNEVGSGEFRPRTQCGIRNLFLAGDYTHNPIDVVTIEAAVVSGLQAAESVRARAHAGQPIDIVLPSTVPEIALLPFKLAGAPYAYAAKAMSVSSRWLSGALREMFPRL
ncbi:MAG TPA: FAD-dependent oxidoreductase [Acetobacteraceae bacterium]|jgi:predicted NAD/FAD-dependent oxidoreductase